MVNLIKSCDFAKGKLTISLRGIQHAWHFLLCVGFCVEVLCRGLVIACFTP
ncbi:DUF3265 domain-containing protein [Vibrio parahaemolyticus]|nr:DUF3265 domain-containing protein [Vibrio parahaemolyticus]EIV8625394.1 DUF3265 domain-containing protein [Vibrio parahaemolyticus]